MNRRKFIKFGSIITSTAIVGGGAVYKITKKSDILDPFFEATKEVLALRFGKKSSEHMIQDILTEYRILYKNMPYIGGKENIFSEWLVYGVYYLGVYKVLKNSGLSLEDIGIIVYKTYEVMADHPKWILRIVGHFKYGQKYLEKLKKAAEESHKRRYPGDWVCTFIEGDGEAYDFGFDIMECGICKFYQANGASEFSPYMCLSDYVVSKAFDRGLVRHKTIAEGAEKCDFRYKKGRKTFVQPLRNGWPPMFIET